VAARVAAIMVGALSLLVDRCSLVVGWCCLWCGFPPNWVYLLNSLPPKLPKDIVCLATEIVCLASFRTLCHLPFALLLLPTTATISVEPAVGALVVLSSLPLWINLSPIIHYLPSSNALHHSLTYSHHLCSWSASNTV